MSGTLVVALIAAAGVVAFVGIIFLLWYCLFRKSISRTSETNSSDPSIQAGGNVELSGGVSYPSGLQGARSFSLEELNLATKNFSSVNLIGYGRFGEVYKGLLQDGMIVAIKSRQAAPSREFVEEVRNLSTIRHRNLVSLLGFCQEKDLQMLVYEYIPNGSVSSHLYGANQMSSEKLEFKNRLTIAHSAAKGLAHLHGFDPPVIHKNFKTANVLVDEDFIPKVADAGLRNLMERIGGASSTSQMMVDDIFIDPEVKHSGTFYAKSDVYSFGVFLLELVSGRDARADQSLIAKVQNYQDPSTISSLVDSRMGSSFTTEGMKEFLRLAFWCLNTSSERRPPMSFIVLELNRIHEKEISLTTVMGEGTPTVLLGSQLFTAAR
ncbi:Non-specific serine/threonine protein kinase protein [Dioscorea alata]|uniref:Non-specific serine/threonine protein kinase protein n=5 Tax=Dioscorea alata TaxID=55571 RepID=A0ACB7UTE6_DIOAL|nr:Non-specific serine/threonine protein kinase protein [Dioscorea alata]KAH7663996.1 Non-specific serine/threonine protein kinase protein [Dioscorea alata]KAH7663998.1 Non-specific serine/threonine protein kinase protein [Dioscorea alata]